MEHPNPSSRLLPLIALFIGLGMTPVQAQTLTQEFVDAGYTLLDLGSITGVPTNYGGLTIRAEEPNTLYIGGAANQGSGAIYAVPLIRDGVTNSITGFAGPATHFVDAPSNDGGLTFTPGGTILFTQYPTNAMGQVLPDQSYVSTDLSALGVGSSVGSHAFVPNGYPGAGSLIVASYSAWVLYNVPFSVAGNGLYSFSAPTAQVSVSGTASGPEGVAYVPLGSTAFPNPSMVVSAYGLGKVVAFEVDPDGLPVTSTARDMVTGLTGAEGAWIDPVTGDFLFSTFGGDNRVVRISGFELPTAIPERSAETFTLFPNPTDGLLQLAFMEDGGAALVEVIDPRGAVVLQRTLAPGPLHTFDLSGHAAGLYSVRVVRDGVVRTQRIVLQRP
jgi:hypothetical protein